MAVIDINTLFGAYPSEHADSTAEILMQLLTKHGVDRAVSLATWGVYFQEEMGNDHTLRAQQHFQGKIIAAATLSPHRHFSDASVDLLAEQPYALFRFFPDIQDWPLDYAPFHQILEALSSYNKPIMVSVRAPGAATQLARITESYDGPVILEGVSSTNLAEALSLLQKYEHLLLETHAIGVPGALEKVRDRIGIDRLLFGSGAPALSLGAALAFVRGSDLSADEQSAVLGGNAERLLLGE